ncbi:lysylphosphatidylglycerol synthase transmembrane domain-containing protein [uncultured Cohaesibacter sp.]|uniref:lysylphosphatidylglycerol synthase transmembrane domain-containing protein n=1 Tax=uncultured Cohaesibacter sp. TaxID=1002546 RepID=UPI0029C8E769|nr:lysylphosphatidylglycerol synthase transmembrane domain-containing protein [uncultured Cohaesibacter sp.]
MRNLAVVSIVFCLVLLAGLIGWTGPAKLLSALLDIPPGHVIASLLIVQVQIIASACRWRFTAGRLGHEIDLDVAIREYYVSSALNLVLPGGMAGDAVRAYRSRNEGKGGWKRPAAAVFLERLSGQAAFFLLSCMGLLAWPNFLSARLPDHYSMLFWIVAAMLAFIVLLAVAFRKALLPERFSGLGADLSAVFWEKGAWLIQSGLSILVIGSYIATFLVASDAVGAPLPAIAAFTVIPLCLLTMLIPVGIGGWGTREAAAAALWPLFGFAGADGLAASLLYGLLCLVGAAVPGVIFIGMSLARRRIGRA